MTEPEMKAAASGAPSGRHPCNVPVPVIRSAGVKTGVSDVAEYRSDLEQADCT
jgi:hypothetical protein